MAEGLEKLTVAQKLKNPNGPLQTFLGSWGPHWTPRVGRFEVSFPRHGGAPKWKFGWASSYVSSINPWFVQVWSLMGRAGLNTPRTPRPGWAPTLRAPRRRPLRKNGKGPPYVLTPRQGFSVLTSEFSR